MEKPSSEVQIPDENRQRIRKAFNLIKTHASAVASFTLQWQDLEDHLNSIDKAINSATVDLQNPIPNPNPNPNPKPPKVLNPNPKHSHFQGIPIRDGVKLLNHLKSRSKDLDSLRQVVRGALEAAGDPSRLVLAAVKGYFPPNPSADSELPAVRKSCVLLLEELPKAAPEIVADVKSEATELAAAWKGKMTENATPTEAIGFLMLLNAYSLVGEFDRDEIVRLFANVAQRRQALDLFRSLGLSDKASDFIQHLVSLKKNTDALKFIYAFKLADKFAPIPLLEEQVKEAKKVSRTVWKNAESSLKDKDDAVNSELAALRSVIKCIEDHKLEADYSAEALKERVEWLKSQKSEMRANRKAARQVAHAQRLSGNKRPFSSTDAGPHHQPHHPHHHQPRPRAGPAFLVPPPPHSPMNHHHRQMRLLDGEARHYYLPRYSAQAQAQAQTQAQYRQPSFVGQEAQYSPTRYSLSAGSPARGGYGAAAGYVPEAQQWGPPRYSVAASDPDNIVALEKRYGQGSEMGLGASPRVGSYYPTNDGEVPAAASSGANHEMMSYSSPYMPYRV